MHASSYADLLWDLPSDKLPAILASGVPVNEPDAHGDYLLTVACQRLRSESVELLLAAGAHPDRKNAEGDTPLLCAIDHVHHDPEAALSIVEMLAAAGADLEIRGYMEKPPFLKACSRNCLPMVKLLVRLGANIHAVVDDGGPPLGGMEFARIFEAPEEMKEYLRGLYRA